MTEGTTLVTGGAGFIGSVLCRALASQGHRVIAFDNLSFGRRELLGPAQDRVSLVEGDIRDPVAVDRVMEAHSPARVFHLAALHFIPYCNAHPVEAVEVNVNGTRNVLAACRRVRPEFVLFTSTAAVYPIEGGPFAESHPSGPLDIYGHTKLAGEDLARLFFLEADVPTVVARFFNAFGPNDTNPHLVPEIAGQVSSGSRELKLGNVDPVRDYIHVEDMAAAVIAILDGFAGGFDVFNVGSGEGHSVRDVVRAFGQAMGRDLSIRQDPERVRRVERQSLVADIAKLRNEMGWSPRWNLEQGIGELVAAQARPNARDGG